MPGVNKWSNENGVDVVFRCIENLILDNIRQSKALESWL